MISYTYTKTSILISALVSEIKSSSISSSIFKELDYDGTTLTISFLAAITPADEATLSTIVSNHNAIGYTEKGVNEYQVLTKNTFGLVTSLASYSDAAKTQKIKEEIFTYNINSSVNTITTIAYDKYGIINNTYIETAVYSGGIFIGMDRVKV